MFLEKINKQLSAAILEAGYEEPKELQQKSFSKIKSGGDAIFIGPVNSGKTSSIVISTIQKLNYAVEDAPRALILVADKERALAMKEQFMLLGRNTDLRVIPVFEEGSMDNIKDAVYQGADVVVGTAKSLNKLYTTTGLNLNKLKMFVIDDASLILKHELQAQISRLSESIPKCQHLLFTEVLTERMEKHADTYMKAPVIVEVEK